MVKPHIKNIAIGLITGIVMSAIMWSFVGRSPLERGFWGEHPVLGISWLTINYPALLIGAVVSGKSHGPSAAAMIVVTFVQWTSIGYLCSWAASRRKPQFVEEKA